MMCSQCLREVNALENVTFHSLKMHLLPLEEDLISQEVGNSFRYILWAFLM